jgi:hypothetical protein
MRSGKLKVEVGGWRMENGGWRMGSMGEKFFARTLSLSAFVAIICHKDAWILSWFYNGQNYHNSLCIVFDYFHKEFIGKSINHRIGKLYIVHYLLILGALPQTPLTFLS